jgi:hypothetical protein
MNFLCKYEIWNIMIFSYYSNTNLEMHATSLWMEKWQGDSLYQYYIAESV